MVPSKTSYLAVVHARNTDSNWTTIISLYIGALGAATHLLLCENVSTFANANDSRLTYSDTNPQVVVAFQLGEYPQMSYEQNIENCSGTATGRARKLIGPTIYPSVGSRRSFNIRIFNLQYIGKCTLTYGSENIFHA